ncbi:gamma-glutamyltransferase [PVC group bacterium]|nr:gamma-glutamyltransferase [PVC group bacterium]
MLIRLGLFALVLTGCSLSQKTYTRGAVAADHKLASEAGVRILEEGGNAVDAAVATSFTLSIVRPFSCGIGGGGFMLIDHPRNELPIALNYRETAPEIMDKLYYENRSSRVGPNSVGVPGTVAGLLAAHDKYGRLPIAQVLAPAIEIAENGFVPDGIYSSGVESARKSLEGVSVELQKVSRAMERFGTNEKIILRGQGEVLKCIARDGRVGFYTGEVAQAIVSATKGHITIEDLNNYKPRWEQPLIVQVGDGISIVSMPPPSSGGIATGQILSLMQRLDATELDRDDPLYSHLLVESMKHAFADRAEHLADAEFVVVPVEELLGGAYLDELSSRIDFSATGNSESYGSSQQLPTDSGTSHFCVVDGEGMVVAATETINTAFGSQVLVEPFDFVLNNEMDDFSPPIGTNVYGLQQSDKNLPEPGKRPLSSMSPTIVLRDGQPIFVVGASGGPRIISGVVQVILNCVWFGDEPIEGISRARLHHQWMPDKIYFESSWNDPITSSSLQSKGHETTNRKTVGVVQAIAIEGVFLKPASDPRKGGVAAGID